MTGGPAGRFSLGGLISRGGQGSIWAAHDRATLRKVALKLPLDPGPGAQARFLQEASLLSELRHPALVEYVAHGLDPELGPFLALGWIEGQSLRGRLGSPMPLGEAAELGARLADALDALHGAGVTHGDLQPDNVMLPGGSVRGARLIDLGLARGKSAAGRGASGGTAGYSAPELGLSRRATPASDLFSLGVLLWELLAGEPPFVDPARAVLLGQRADASALRALRPDVPSALASLLASLLEVDPASRPSARQLRAWLSLPMGAPPGAAPGGELAGRQRELDWLDAVATRPGRALLVRGPAGSGKSSLLWRWADRVGAPVASGRPGVAPFGTMAELLLQSDGPPSGEPLARLAGDNFALRALFDSWPQRLRWALEAGQLVFVIDDLPWADEASLALLEDAAARGELCLVASARPGPSGLSGRCRVEELWLPPLAPGEAAAAVRARWPGASEAQAAEIAEAASGLPSLVSGLSAAQGERASLLAAARRLLEGRTDLERRALRAISLLGFQATAQAVASVLGGGESQAMVDLALGQLVDAWLLVRGPSGALALRHEAARQVCLEGEVEGEPLRRALGWLEARGEQDSLLAWVAEREGRLDEAAARYNAAAWRSFGRDFLSAQRLADLALRCSGGQLGQARACRLLAIAWQGRWGEALASCAQAYQAVAPGSLEWVAVVATWAFGSTSAGHYTRATLLLAELCSVDPDREALELHLWALGINSYAIVCGLCSRDLVEGLVACAERLLPPEAPPSMRASALRLRASAVFSSGERLDEALSLASRSADLFLEAGDPISSMQARILTGLILLEQGAPRAALDAFVDVLGLSDRLETRGLAIFAAIGRVEALIGLGEHADALAWGLALLDQPGLDQRRYLHGWALRALGAAHLAGGDPEEAIACADRAVEAIGSSSKEMVAALALRARARLAVSDLDLALRDATLAVEILDNPDPSVPDLHGSRALLAEARARLAQRRPRSP